MEDDKKKEIAVIEITEEYMKDRLYEFRGKKVMLDSDLAEIYGYETKNFKRQVKNNIAKFEGDDFMFEFNKLHNLEFIDFCKEYPTVNLSMKNGWIDDQGMVFIYYSIKNICEDLNCGTQKACKLSGVIWQILSERW